ncbi:MAG: hypothetical protein V3V67_03350 [Myxococcota bacterium]
MAQAAQNLAEQTEVAPAQQDAPTRVTTLLDLVAAVADASSSDAEVIATIKDLINSGKVTLVGEFLGADVKVL